MLLRRISPWVALLVVVVGVFLARPALAARTLAVMPLTRAAGSAEYDGLGDALAGMLVSDLSTRPELSLVERARLDALLTELELAESDFVDPKTAAKMGRGLGAELVLVGTFSVLDERFLMDARVVEVDSGKVRKAASAQGTRADFVAVEKEIVEGLLADLDIALSGGDRRRLLIEAPTETFDALAAWGEGLAEARRGRQAEAQAAFERALKADPSFAEARASLESLSAMLAQLEAKDAQAIDAERAKALAAVVKASPGPTGVDPDDEDSVGALLLAWLALSDQGEDCRVAEEKLRFLRRNDWRAPLGEGSRLPRFNLAVLSRLADGHGYEVVPHELEGPRRMQRKPHNRISDKAARWIAPGDGRKREGEEDTLVDNILRCAPGPKAARDLRRLADNLDGTPLGATRRYTTEPELTTVLRLQAAYEEAATVGASANLEQRLTSLIEGASSEEEARRIRDIVTQITRRLEQTRYRLTARGGATEDMLIDFGEALVDGDADVIALDRRLCQVLSRNEAQRAVTFVDQARNTPHKDSALNLLGPAWRAFHRTGCLVGVDGTWPTPEDVLAGVRATLARAPTPEGECKRLALMITQQSSDAHLENVRSWAGDGTSQWVWAILSMLHAFEDNGCVDPLPLSGTR